MLFRHFLVTLLWFAHFGSHTLAQHQHGGDTSRVAAPKIFLDKSPRIVDYQLRRLSNEQLLLVERNDQDPKYRPVFAAILSREGMSRGAREEALAGLVALNGTTEVEELSSILSDMTADQPATARMRQGLAAMLLEQPSATLASSPGPLQALAAAEAPTIAAVGYAALIVAGQDDKAWHLADMDNRWPALLQGIPLVPSPHIRSRLHARVWALSDAQRPLETQRAALQALATIPAQQEQTFLRAAERIRLDDLRTAAVQALLSVPRDARDSDTSQALIEWLVDYAERTPAAQRTDGAFLDAMQLVDQLLATAPAEIARLYRERLRQTVVHSVRIQTVAEEMRYDLPYFAVEAGRPVQIVLVNSDIMPHNLVVTMPGALQEVAELGLQAGPQGGVDGKQYVPASNKVLFASHMVASEAQESLNFTAPTETGEYPYVCTFPRHWMRMYGVMVVVDDLQAWLENPVEPRDPIGSNRHFVRSWTIDDFPQDLQLGLRGRTPHIGEKLFAEATCALCHRLGPHHADARRAENAGTSGDLTNTVGPDLTSVLARWKGDVRAVLQEVLDPSYRVDDKYAVHLILTVDGRTVSGLVVEETKMQVAILENPEAQQPTIIPRSQIEQMVKTSNSMMPKGLLDRFSQDEIFEILAFIHGQQREAAPRPED
ncbi:MAG: hypothetical protein KDA45_07085 [Planctomycetales bacterium]|nr:hypothetical protein [Planctomycetales bacterium]